ncbi:MAG: rhomboid protease GluP, partial [Verrucomicrobiales bacterium]
MQDEHRNSQPYPWVARILSIICVAICIGLMGRGEFPSWEFYAKFGYLSPESIWRGSYWSLFTSTLVHLEIWHLAFNVYWLWILGGRLEQSIGSLRFLAFFIAAGTIASSFQLAVSGTTGIGASGALYALFGFMWLARDRYPEFRQILDPRTVWLFLIWLVACYVITHFGDFRIGNTAHLSGLLFGCAVAGVRMGRSRAPA